MGASTQASKPCSTSQSVPVAVTGASTQASKPCSISQSVPVAVTGASTQASKPCLTSQSVPVAVTGASTQASKPCSISQSVPVAVTGASTQASKPCSISQSVSPIGLSTSPFHCKLCGANYAHKRSLFKHLQQKHPNEQQAGGNIKCLEDTCAFTCYHLDGLRSHLEKVHCFSMESEKKSFQCIEGKYTYSILKIV